MITAIRRQFKGAAHRFILWIIIVAIAVGLITPIFLRKTIGGGPWAIKVNNEEISYQEFIREVTDQRNRLASFRAEYGQIADLLLQSMGISADPKTLTFNQLVKEELLNQFAQDLGLYLHPDYIMQKINDQQFVEQHLAHIIPPYLFNNAGTINRQAVGMHLKRQGMSRSMFERTVERALTRQFVMELMKATLYVPIFDIKQQYIRNNASKKFNLLFFSFTDFLKKEKEKKVTDELLKAFFDKQNRRFKRYWVPEKRSGLRWKFEPHSYAIVVTQEEITAYYEDNKTKKFVDEPTKVQVRQIVIKDPANTVSLATIRQELLKNPAEFADKAKELSQDPESAKNGGLLEPFFRGQKEQSFERAAFLLKNDDAISQIIKTSEGEVLLQRVEKIGQTYKPLARVEDKIKKTLMEQKFKEEFAQDMKRVIENKDKREQLLTELVAKKGGKSDKITPIAKSDTKLAQTLFKLEEGIIAFYVEGNVGVAVKLTAVSKQYLPSLESIKSVVVDDFYQEGASDALQRALKKAKQAVKTKSFKELQEEFGVNREETAWIRPQDAENKRMLEKQGLPITKMMQLDSIGMILDEQAGQDGYLVRLDEIRIPEIAPDDEEWDKAKNKIDQSRTNLYIEAFVASLFRNATIKTNESIIIADE